MAYDVDLADRIRTMLPAGTPEKAMFGGLAFLVGGRLAVAAGGGGAMMVRCDPREGPALVAEDGVEHLVMRGRELDGWLLVSGPAVADEQSLARWVAVGTSYARSLPPT